ncbi:hypothetical protein HRbin39_00338 [bacterium HR39]|nr:hypothetical protein HRbin39_00338 [bacterium HR39]
MRDRKLKLRAEDAEDLAVLAALLQDARAPLFEMVYQPGERRFAAVFRRYRREAQPHPDVRDGLTEVACALVFEEIEAVRHRGLDPADRERVHRLLTIATHPGRERLVHIHLVFDGGAEIRLECDRIRARMEDFGEIVAALEPPPFHPLDEPAGERG